VQEITPKVLVDAAEQGDGSAVQTIQRYERRLAKSLAHVINMLDPDAIVLGGGMGNIESLYVNVPALLPEYVFSDVVNTKIVAPVHGDSSGVRGAAWLWNR
jgi:fructokinase